jgi:hypothetical protein
MKTPLKTLVEMTTEILKNNFLKRLALKPLFLKPLKGTLVFGLFFGTAFSVALLILPVSALANPAIEIETKDVKSCDKMETQIEVQGRMVSSLTEFKGKTLVARRVFQIVDDLDSKARLYLETSLLPKSQQVKVMCSSGSFPMGKRVFSKLPLIIELTDEKALGDTFWNFQLYRNNQGLFVLNNKEMSISERAVDYLKAKYPEFQILEIFESRIRIHMSEAIKGIKQTTVIEYDFL